MTTIAQSTSAGRTLPLSRPRDDTVRRGKKEKRSDIWSNLLRQTREAQARSRTQTLQHRELLICGGSPEDQQTFVRSLARPPPPAPPSRNRDPRPQRPRGEVKLSNKHAYGYGHVTLYSPPQQTAGLLGAEAEEAVRVEIHTVPEPEGVYEGTLRRLLGQRIAGREAAEDGADEVVGGEGTGTGMEEGSRRPEVCLLLSWKEPWRFLSLLRQWLQLLAKSLLPPDASDEDAMDVLKEHKLALTVVVQHVEAQESLEREGYREESFDYISQCLRTAVLPLSAALVYTSSSTPPQQPASVLSDVQKVIFTSMSLDLAPLSPAPSKGTSTSKRDDLIPKHNVVDRMAIVVPGGWDSLGKIRLLSETFSPEAVLEAWTADLSVPVSTQSKPTERDEAPEQPHMPETQANGGAERQEPEAEVYATSEVGDEDSELALRPLSPSKQPLSAISTFEAAVLNPNAHKEAKSPQIEVITKPTQQFLAEMRTHLLELEAQDAERAKANPDRSTGVSTTAGALHGASGNRMVGLPAGEQSGALDNLGDVSFNAGGINYNTVSAAAAIERIKRPPQPTGLESSPIAAASPTSGRNITPRQPRREDRGAAADVTPRSPQRNSARSGSGREGSAQPMDKLEVDKLEEYFASLMKKGTPGGGTGSGTSTPSKAQR